MFDGWPGMSGSPEGVRCPVGLRKFIEPCLLLFLRERRAYGYELIEMFTTIGFENVPDPGSVYRNLRRMENEGFVRSRWELAESGMPRRFYEITEEGEYALNAWVKIVQKNKEMLEDFLARYHGAK
jgi:PadR family transcriptional regulator PadR